MDQKATRALPLPKTYSDEYLHYWGEIYRTPGILRTMIERRVSFETFLIAPAEILAALRTPRTGLLPTQLAARERIDLLQVAERMTARAFGRFARRGARVENGRMIEKLRHRAYPRHQDRRDHAETV